MPDRIAASSQHDCITIDIEGHCVLLIERKPNGTEGMTLQIPLADYRDELAVTWEAWVALLQQRRSHAAGVV